MLSNVSPSWTVYVSCEPPVVVAFTEFAEAISLSAGMNVIAESSIFESAGFTAISENYLN